MSALETAAAAVRYLHYVHDTGDGDPDEVTDVAADAVTDAIIGGGHSHDAIAAIAGVDGSEVVRLIRDDVTRGQAWRRERFLAEHYLAMVRDGLREEALHWVWCGVDKKYTAATLGISRPTLDAWIRDRAEEISEQSQPGPQPHG